MHQSFSLYPFPLDKLGFIIFNTTVSVAVADPPEEFIITRNDRFKRILDYSTQVLRYQDERDNRMKNIMHQEYKGLLILIKAKNENGNFSISFFGNKMETELEKGYCLK